LELILFDVDLTLLASGGAGVRALNSAMLDIYGLQDAFAGVEFAGRTDRVISEEGLRRSGIDPGPEAVSGLRSVYVRRLAGELASPGCTARALTGAKRLLDALSTHPGAAAGLLTGNWKEGAFLKLAACGLDRYFTFGGFADDGYHRAELFPAALSKGERLKGRTFSPGRAWVVGDTPHDVACGRAWGARTLGVATGPYDRASLVQSGATAVVDDLGDTEAVLSALLGDQGRG
jgi:phosphoglycolate phosphatase